MAEEGHLYAMELQGDYPLSSFYIRAAAFPQPLKTTRPKFRRRVLVQRQQNDFILFLLKSKVVKLPLWFWFLQLSAPPDVSVSSHLNSWSSREDLHVEKHRHV